MMPKSKLRYDEKLAREVIVALIEGRWSTPYWHGKKLDPKTVQLEDVLAPPEAYGFKIISITEGLGKHDDLTSTIENSHYLGKEFKAINVPRGEVYATIDDHMPAAGYRMTIAFTRQNDGKLRYEKIIGDHLRY